MTSESSGWEQLYKSSPTTYQTFADASDPDNVILSFVERKVAIRGCRVLEIGAGTGKYSALLSNQAALWLGIDRSSSLLKTACKNSMLLGSSNVHFLQLDAVDLIPEFQGFFDSAISMWAINAPWSDPIGQIASTVDSVLAALRRPESRFALVTTSPGALAGEYAALMDPDKVRQHSCVKREFVCFLSDHYGFESADINYCWRFRSADDAAHCFTHFFAERRIAGDILNKNRTTISGRATVLWRCRG